MLRLQSSIAQKIVITAAYFYSTKVISRILLHIYIVLHLCQRIHAAKHVFVISARKYEWNVIMLDYSAVIFFENILRGNIVLNRDDRNTPTGPSFIALYSNQ